MKSRDRKIFRIIDGLYYTEHVFLCDGCQKTSSFTCCEDEWSAAEAAYNEGWRPGRKNVYCPKCAKKKLKSK